MIRTTHKARDTHNESRLTRAARSQSARVPPLRDRALRQLLAISVLFEEASAGSSNCPLRAVRIDEPGDPVQISFIGVTDAIARSRFEVLAMQAMPLVIEAGATVELDPSASAAGNWLRFVTDTMRWSWPSQHGVWVESPNLDASEERFTNVDDVFYASRVAIQSFLAEFEVSTIEQTSLQLLGGTRVPTHQVASQNRSSPHSGIEDELVDEPSETFRHPLTDDESAVLKAIRNSLKPLNSKQIAAAIGNQVTAEAVRKRISRVKLAGFKIEARRGLGYFELRSEGV